MFNVQGKKQTCFKEPGDIDIKKLVANALLESTNKSKNMNEQVHNLYKLQSTEFLGFDLRGIAKVYSHYGLSRFWSYHSGNKVNKTN